MIGVRDSANELAALNLLEAALAQVPGRREAYIASRDDLAPAVRERALELLLGDRDAMAALQTGGAGDGLYANDDIAPEIPGYRIVRPLGRGGMGSVWLAERDGGDFEHFVAIKVIRPGAISDGLIERFRRERQILARLNHPNIARLYDGGETEEGQPYIVMEHVAGASLRDWLSETPAPIIKRRLELFRQIATAVGFAHQNLIIHRDLTPGNVLIDEAGSAKLIDFGIARPPRAGEEMTAASRITGLSLTPGFAAPERARGEASNTLSDIYSLGRILDLMIGKDAPPELTAIAACAAAPGPEDRYSAVSDLIEELDRYTQGRTVPSFSTSRKYRVSKFVRRQRLLVGAIAAVIVALAGGLAGTSWSYYRAEEARSRAEKRFGEVRDLANFMLYDLYEELEPVTGNTRALVRIADRASGYLDTLAHERNADPDLKLETANGLKRLSDVLGNPIDRNLGRREDAGRALRRSVVMLEGLHRMRPTDFTISRSLAEAQMALSVFVFIAEDKSEEAIGPARRAAELYTALARSPAGTTADWIGVIEAHLQAAKPLVWIDKGPAAVEQMRGLVTVTDKLASQHPDDKAVFKAQARVLTALSSAMSWTYNLETQRADFLRSIPLSTKSIALFDRLHRRFPDDQSLQRELMGAHFVRALIYYDLDLFDAAHRDLAAAEYLAADLLKKDPDDSELSRRLQGFRGQHAPILVAMGRQDDAIALARLALAERQKLVDQEPDNAGYFRDRTSARRALGETLLLSKREREGCEVYRQTRREWRTIERRWGISAINQTNDVDTIDAGLASCRPHREIE